MPKEITHWLIAEEIFAALARDSASKRIIAAHKNLYLLGAVLPDSPLYMKRGSNRTAIQGRGSSIHDAPDSYAFIKNHFKNTGGTLPDAELALLFGIITHFCADSVFHPFVYFFCGKDRAKHFTFETYLDLCFKGGNTPSHKWLFKNILRAIETDKDQLIRSISSIFFNQDSLDHKSIRTMLDQHAFIQSQFDNPVSRIILRCFNLLPGINMDKPRALFYPVVKPEPGTFFNRKYGYQHPVTGKNLSADLDALKKKTVDTVVSLFNAMYTRKKFHNETLDALHGNANTGLPGKTIHDMQYFSETEDFMKVLF